MKLYEASNSDEDSDELDQAESDSEDGGSSVGSELANVNKEFMHSGWNWH